VSRFPPPGSAHDVADAAPPSGDSGAPDRPDGSVHDVADAARPSGDSGAPDRPDGSAHDVADAARPSGDPGAPDRPGETGSSGVGREAEGAAAGHGAAGTVAAPAADVSSAHPAHRSSEHPAYRRTAVWTAVWVAFIAVAFGVGAAMRASGALPVDALPPLHASARLLITPLVPAVVVALTGVALLPAAARRLRRRPLLAVAWLASALWAVILQWPDGVARPLTAPTEYLGGLPAIGDHPLAWLRGFTRHLQEYPTHIKGHPPLPDLILWILRWTGLNEPGWAAALVIAVGTSSVAAVAMTIRTLADEETARRALPFLVLTPSVLCLATSVDALFLGVAAWAVALTAEATAPGVENTPHPPGGTSPLQSSSPVDDGHKGFHRLWITVRLWAGVDASARTAAAQGLSPDAPGVRPPSLARERLRPGFVRERLRRPGIAGERLRRPGLVGRLPVAFALGCAVVPLAFTLGGFLWWDGVAATHAAWAAGAGSDRPYAYFFFGDLAALALIIGPLAAAALPYVLRRGRALGVLAAAALLGVLALDLSGVTRGEVERIWLPYAPWLTAAAAVYRPPARRVLLVQAVTALLIQALVRSPW
jgi:hypothetical protein